MTKNEKSAYLREWRKNNPEAAKSHIAKWRLDNPTHIKEYNDTYYQKNKERLQEMSRNYQKKKREALLADPEAYAIHRAKLRDPTFLAKKAAYQREYIRNKNSD